MTVFILFYSVIYMGNSVYGTFIPIYFQSVGSTPAQIGLLLSLGPLVATLAQPLWGALGDRAKSKNSVLRLLLLGSGAAIVLFPLSAHLYYLMLMVCLFTFFQTSIFAMSDAITLEEIDKHKRWSFGPIRLGGTLGFAVMSLAFGWIAGSHISYLFAVYALIMAAALFLLQRFPSVAGYQSIGNRMNIGVLFKNRQLMMYMGLNLVLQITLGYFYTFFPIYFSSLGGNSLMLGWSMVISGLSEVPFLLYSGKIIKRIRMTHILLICSVVTAVRWYIFSVAENAYWILPTQLLHGMMFIVLSVTMAMYINKEVPKELKASGQMFNGLLSLGLARIIGSFFGGIASESFGMKQIFLFNAWLAAICAVIIVCIIIKEPRGKIRRLDAINTSANKERNVF